MKAQLHIQTALRNSKTYLKNAFHTTPFKIADVTEDKTQKPLRLMLMTSSPGILNGDDYNIEIDIAEDCTLELQTQSYQRLFSMTNGASQTMEVRMQKNASFHFLPHPTVPHKNAYFIAKNKIYLSTGCSLIWSDVFTCGRKLSGEAFAFSKYHSITKFFFNNKMVVKENLLLQPATTNASAIGQLEGYTHQSSFLYINETVSATLLVQKLNELLTTENVCFGVSILPVNGVIVRMLGFKGEQLYNLHKKMAAFIIQLVTNPAKATAYAV
jgi:urease accessory protein